MAMVRDLPVEERPRERLLALGPGFLSNAELLAILLRNGFREKSALDMAGDVLKQCGPDGIGGLVRLSIAQLGQMKGIGTAKAAELMAAVELGRRMAAHSVKQKLIVTCPEDAAEYAFPRFKYEEREHFAVILMNVKNHILSMPVISIGSLTASVVHPREVFKPAILSNAAAIILAHNHPSGKTNASKSDIEITEQMVKAGKILGIGVLDHVIVGYNTMRTSIKEEGRVNFD